MKRHSIYLLAMLLLGVLPVLAAATVVIGAASLPTCAAADVSGVELQAQSSERDIKVDIDVNRGGGRWYANPVWVAIAVLAFLILVVLIILAVRGGAMRS